MASVLRRHKLELGIAVELVLFTNTQPTDRGHNTIEDASVEGRCFGCLERGSVVRKGVPAQHGSP